MTDQLPWIKEHMAAEGNICEKKIEAENPGWRGISKKIDNFFSV